MANEEAVDAPQAMMNSTVNPTPDRLAVTGLTGPAAAERLALEGYNELPSARPRSMVALAWDVVREPMFVLLVAAGTIYLMLGDTRQALMLFVMVVVVIGITLYQVRKTERALDALRDLTSPRALVIRDGVQQRIPGREVARGDVLVLAEGDRVPADGVLLSCAGFAVDESLLTGESVPVRKAAAEGVPTMARPGGDDHPFVFSGTLVVQGHGLAQVLATGLGTEIGRIGKALATVEREPTPLQRETGRAVRRLAVAGVVLCVVLAVVYGLTRGDWLNGVLAGLTLSMAILPEEFPVVLTVFLALGAWRISQQQVLTRRVAAVETLGAATVLCVDKTGTLTENRMSVAALCAHDRVFDLDELKSDELPDEVHRVLEFGILASQRRPFDPMDKALHQVGARTLERTEHLHGDWTLVDEYLLSKELLAMSRVWRSPDGGAYVIAAKGAPEAIADLCHLNAVRIESLGQRVDAMAKRGLRVLGVAGASFTQDALPQIQHDFDFQLVGLIGFRDPVRPTVAAAIKESHHAGIRVVMITGDHLQTAQHVAREIGLEHETGFIIGPELDTMDDAELRRRLKTVNIFCRAAPEQKLRLVNALKADGHIVAMTGDGVNDAPALKAAHIGIAMGERGTDVARESAALVLLNDDFSSIVHAVRLGRRIFDNLKKAVAFIIAVHVPIIGVSLIPVALGWPLVLFPVHIVFLELIIDPACTVAFEAEPEEADVMQRPPRPADASLFDRRTVTVSLLQGVAVLLIVLAVFSLSLFLGHGADEARALTFTTLVIANLGLIFTNRSWTRTIPAMLGTPNRAFWWVTGGTLAFLAMVLYVPSLSRLFQFAPLHAPDLVLCLVAGVVTTVWFELVKVFNAGRRRSLAGRGPLTQQG